MRVKYNRIYIASPYSHSDSSIMAKRFREITKIAAKLFIRYDCVFLLPITQGHLLSKIGNIESDFKRWKAQSLGMLAACQEIWVIKMDGWKQSKGVNAEIRFARKFGIPIKYLDPKNI